MQTVHYRAVVFDLDGTAVDSRYNIDALQLTCQEMLGRSATDEELKITYGMTAANAMRYLGVADDQIELFVQRWEQNIMALCQNASLYEGIYPVMCKLHQAGMLVGINTSRRSNELGDLHAYIREPFFRPVQPDCHLRQGAAPEACTRFDAVLLPADRSFSQGGPVCGGQRI